MYKMEGKVFKLLRLEEFWIFVNVDVESSILYNLCFFFFLLIKLSFIFSSSFLILLILRNKIVHVRFSFSELHFIHSLACVPMKKSFSPEHGSELFRNSLEQLLDGSGISNESGSRLETSWRDVTNSNLDVVWNPFHKVGRVLVLDVQHLLVHLLHGHATSEHGCNGEVTSMSWITGSHHVFGVKHLLG